MAEIMLALVIAIVFAIFGMSFFPSLHTMLLDIDTTGMPYLLEAGVKFMPYAIVFAIVYGIILIISHRNKNNA